MLAVDTNIVVRYLVQDDPEQSGISVDLIENQQVFVPVTVVLEVAWVLRSSYRLTPATVVSAIKSFVRLATVIVQHSDAVYRALDWAADGVQFDDALHLSLADQASAFSTFDRAFAKRMAGKASVPLRML